MVFASRPLIMRVFLRPPESEISTLLLFVLKEMGGFVLMLTLMLFFASRDPVRNVAIVDALIVGLVILAATPLLSLYTLDIDKTYPRYLVWGRSLVRLAIAGALLSSEATRERFRACRQILRDGQPRVSGAFVLEAEEAAMAHARLP